jgi:putative DNA primase/helicase
VTIASFIAVAKAGGWVDPGLALIVTAESDAAVAMTNDALGGLSLSVEDAGDVAGGEIFAHIYRGKMLFNASTGAWMRWNGVRWVPCPHGSEIQSAKAAARQVRRIGERVATEAPDSPRAKGWFAYWRALTANMPKLVAMVNMAATEPGMSATQPDFDQDQFMLHVQNGDVDLRTGKLLASDPKRMMSKQAGAAYDPDAKCPQFLAALEKIFEKDLERISYLKRLAGYMLTGSACEHMFGYWEGEGSNGKSVIVTVFRAMLGDYAVTMRVDAIMRSMHRGGDNPSPEIARLAGARGVFTSEPGDGDVLDDGVIKSLASSDRLSASHKYKNPFEFDPTFKIIMPGNNPPGIRDGSHGMTRRIHVLPFRKKFTDEEADKELPLRIIADEIDGVLMWAVEGALEWQRTGLRPPQQVQDATRAYAESADLIGHWMEDNTTKESAGQKPIPTNTLYQDYKQYAYTAGKKDPGTLNWFTRQMKRRGFDSVPMGNPTKRCMSGIWLRR